MKKKRPKDALLLMKKVKHQLEELKKPVMVKRFKTAIRDKRRQIFPTVEDYQKMDPCWMSTMGGPFAGRVLGRKR